MEVANNIFSRLVRNKKLASGFNKLKINFSSILYAPNLDSEFSEDEYDFKNKCVTNFSNFINEIESLKGNANQSDYLECISTIQGAKGLWKPQDRKIADFGLGSKVKKIGEIESQILLFDKNQQEGYIVIPDGPQRIRGLAGSGKTVVLAMKAALTLLRSEDNTARILYTYTTKNLHQHVQRLIQRFYREFDDDLSNLDRISIKHSWGGRTNDGVYYEACMAFNHPFLTFPEAKKLAPQGMDPFDFACKNLLDNVSVTPIYDYVFVDEAQDYNKYFLRLCTKLARNKRVTFGADVFQNIFQSQVPTASEIYDDGTSFQREIFLKVCYRAPLSILVCAHAIGLGVHNKQVQKIETVDHWNSLGYKVISRDSGIFEEREAVTILREKENSPTLGDEDPNKLISLIKSEDMSNEIASIALRIINDVKQEGLFPEDILVMCADDYRCKRYFSELNDILSEHGIYTNNIHADKYIVGDFRIKDRVTLSTIHKAKGNEAYSVYLMGTDFLSYNLNVRNRNLIFTAFTRTKGWLTISGVGNILDELFGEIEKAKNQLPYIKFNYPNKQEAREIEHDLQVAEQYDEKDLTEYKKLLDKYGSKEKLEAFFAESQAKKGKK